jgi:hypothetical protein
MPFIRRSTAMSAVAAGFPSFDGSRQSPAVAAGQLSVDG